MSIFFLNKLFRNKIVNCYLLEELILNLYQWPERKKALVQRRLTCFCLSIFCFLSQGLRTVKASKPLEGSDRGVTESRLPPSCCHGPDQSLRALPGTQCTAREQRGTGDSCNCQCSQQLLSTAAWNEDLHPPQHHHHHPQTSSSWFSSTTGLFFTPLFHSFLPTTLKW